MIGKVSGLVRAVRVQNFVSTSTRSVVTNGEFTVFPREREGNNYDTNHSLIEDGLLATGDAFRNARLALLTSKLNSKVQNGVVEVKLPSYFGKYNLIEAGDTINHEDFTDFFDATSARLSNGNNIYVEDVGLGAHNKIRLGTRISTEDAATALIMRKLLIPIPLRYDHNNAKFKGWNLDPRHQSVETHWNGETYDIESVQTEMKPGQRSVIAFVGGESDKVAVQFVEKEREIVGANVVVGLNAPVRGLVEAVGHAGSVIFNEDSALLALPSLVLTKGQTTTVVVNADDTLLSLAAKAGQEHTIYGAYNNVLTSQGVTALWNGFIGAAPTSSTDDVPAVVQNGSSVTLTTPDNLAWPATRIVFFEQGAAVTGKISEDDAVARLVALTDESKTALIRNLLQGVDLVVAGSHEQVSTEVKRAHIKAN